MAERQRLWLYLLAALLPGGCSVFWASDILPDASAIIRTRGVLPVVLDFWTLVHLSGYAAAIYFGFLAIQSARGRATKGYWTSLNTLLAALALVGFATFVIFIFRMSSKI
jgi:hypothetical protein